MFEVLYYTYYALESRAEVVEMFMPGTLMKSKKSLESLAKETLKYTT
jgi:hypothetical protein